MSEELGDDGVGVLFREKERRLRIVIFTFKLQILVSFLWLGKQFFLDEGPKTHKVCFFKEYGKVHLTGIKN